MLNELIEAIGYDNILDVIQNNKPNKAMCFIRIKLNEKINIDEDVLILNPKKDINIKNQRLYDWFSQRQFYVDQIESNKGIMVGKYKYNKVITSNQSNCVKFNLETLVKKIKVDHKNQYTFLEGLKYAIYEFCNKLDDMDKIKYYDEAVELISKMYEENKLPKKLAIGLYLDIPIEEYKLKNENYLNKNILNDSNNRGVFSLFATCNEKKPHLFMKDNIYNNNSAYKCNIEEAKCLFNLKKYLLIKPYNSVKYKNGIIKYECDGGDIIKYEYIPHSIYDLFVDNPLYIDNYKVDNASKFWSMIDKLVPSDKMSKNESFKNNYEKYYSNLNTDNVKQFKIIYKKMINSLYMLSYNNIKDENNMCNLIKINIYTSDYFFNTNIVEEYSTMKENIINKIKNLKGKEYIIDSEDEYWYLIGAVAEYLVSQSQSQNNYIVFKMNYCKLNLKEQILRKLELDFARYGYNIEMKGSRVEKIYSAILNYSDNLDEKAKINKLKLQQGLFETNKIIYVEGEKKNDKK